MKSLKLNQMEVIQGGELTDDEIYHFLGAASCAGAWALFSALSCVNYLREVL